MWTLNQKLSNIGTWHLTLKDLFCTSSIFKLHKLPLMPLSYYLTAHLLSLSFYQRKTIFIVSLTENLIAITDKSITVEKNIGDNRYFDKSIIAEKSIGGENRWIQIVRIGYLMTIFLVTMIYFINKQCYKSI